MKSRRLSLFLTFLKIGAFTFGGGYAMIALLEHELIEKKGWIGHDEFLDMAAIAESTPGPVAVNAATYRLPCCRGVRRGACHTGRVPAVVPDHFCDFPIL